VVAIVGQQARAALGGDYQQEVDLLSLFKDVAHEYVHMATVPEQVRAYLSALAKGDPQAIDVVIATAKEWWDGMFPGGGKSGGAR
jgi:thiamine pyrophosphate-dependent acetolactate synthase large subunit-like protein